MDGGPRTNIPFPYLVLSLLKSSQVDEGSCNFRLPPDQPSFPGSIVYTLTQWQSSLWILNQGGGGIAEPPNDETPAHDFVPPVANDVPPSPGQCVFGQALYEYLVAELDNANKVGRRTERRVANVEHRQDYIQGAMHYYGERQAHDVYDLRAFLHVMHHQPPPPPFVPPYYPPYPGDLSVGSDED